MIYKLLNWIEANKFEFAMLVIILVLGLFLRLYDVGSAMHFGQDEARDAFVVKSITEGNLVLLGPAAPNNWSGFHLGPAMYYLLVPFYWLGGLSPVGGVWAIAIFSSASLFLVYYLGRQLLGRVAGLSASALFAVSFLMVYYGRWAWNPNYVPFFALLIFLSLLKLTQLKASQKNERWLYVLAIASGLAIQFHGTVLISLPLLLAAFFIIFRPKVNWKKYAIAVLVFLIVNLPQIAYDLTHGFANAKGFVKVIFQSESGSQISLLSRIKRTAELTIDFWQQSLVHRGLRITVYLLLGCSLFVLFFYFWQAMKKKRKDPKVILVFLWLAVPLFVFIFYKEAIPVHYFAFMFPLPFLMLGWLWQYLWKNKWLSATVIILTLTLVSLQLFYSVNFLKDISQDGSRASSYPVRLSELQKVSEYAKEDSQGAPFIFTSLPENAYTNSYSYLFSLINIRPIQDAQVTYTAIQGGNIKASQYFSDSTKLMAVKVFGNVTVFKIDN